MEKEVKTQRRKDTQKFGGVAEKKENFGPSMDKVHHCRGEIPQEGKITTLRAHSKGCPSTSNILRYQFSFGETLTEKRGGGKTEDNKKKQILIRT